MTHVNSSLRRWNVPIDLILRRFAKQDDAAREATHRRKSIRQSVRSEISQAEGQVAKWEGKIWFKHVQEPMKNGDFMGIYGGLMGFNGIEWDLVGF